MNDSHSSRDARSLFPAWVARHATLFVVLGVGITAAGFVWGIQELPQLEPPAVPAEPTTPPGVPDAVAYRDLPTAGLKANDHWQNQLADLRFDKPGPFQPVTRTEEMKLEALADRARNRAFDMAPPVVPHPIEQPTAASCLACHGEGLVIQGRLATRVSHPHLTSCTQCHIETTRPELDRFAGTIAGSEFVGAYRSGPGNRAGPGAPPTIPHTSWMRQDCTSCHGLVARAGLRTTHPWLTNCTQCHAPSATLDQVGFPLPQEPTGSTP